MTTPHGMDRRDAAALGVLHREAIVIATATARGMKPPERSIHEFARVWTDYFGPLTEEGQ